MICREVMEHIEARYPKEYALDWDNVGLLAGRDDKEVHSIYIALDATEDVIEAAIASGADMLITHHPLIFSPVKSVTNEDFIGARLIRLIKADISYYAMHTNYDVLGMAQLAAERMYMESPQVLEETRESEGIGRIADYEEAIELGVCASVVKRRFGLTHVKVFGELTGMVKRIAIAPGSGKSFIKQALLKQADVLITGDIDHHEGIDAVAQGLSIIDAGHYGIEHIFIAAMKHYLEEHLADIKVTAAPISHPFRIV